MWVGLSYPGEGGGAPWNMICSQNLACMLLTCYNKRYRRICFNSNRRQRKDTCKVETSLWFSTIFTNLAFYLPALQSLDLNGTFVWANGGCWFLLCNVKLAWFCVNLSTTPSDRRKIQGPLASLLFLNLYYLYPSHMNLHLPGYQFSLDFFVLLYPRQQQNLLD